MKDRIAEFLANVYSPANMDSAPEKLRKAVELLREIGQQVEPAPTPEDIL